MNGPTLIWLKQIGTPSSDLANAIATDQMGNVFICGSTWGALEEGQSQGQVDAFLAKFDAQGRQTWIKQIGTPSFDSAFAIATDYLGNAFICGYTYGNLEEGQPQDQADAFLAKYDVQGNEIWLKQIGTLLWDQASAIATDQLGNVFICGTTYGDLEEGQHQGQADAFLAKYDTQGNEIWLKQIGTPSWDQANAIATDQLGNVFIGGVTYGDLKEGQHQGGCDAFLAKYDAQGNEVWLEQFGTVSSDHGYAIATDQVGNVFIGGATHGALEEGQHQGGWDIFLAKYDMHGNKVWLKQTGTASHDFAYAIATDQRGNIFISGSTWSALEADQHQGADDVFLAKYADDLSVTHHHLLIEDKIKQLELLVQKQLTLCKQTVPTRVWLKQIGTTSSDSANAIATDHLGNVFISGTTHGDLEEGQNPGNANSFVAKYDMQGREIWLKQIRVAYNSASAVATDRLGNVFIGGQTLAENIEEGQFVSSGYLDAFLAKYNMYGRQIWIKQIFGIRSDDYTNGIATDDLGNVFICGSTGAELEEGQYQGMSDIFLAKYDAQGNQVWLKQTGTPSYERAYGIATDYLGNVFICGSTQGELEEGQHQGYYDAFLAKYNSQGRQIWLKQIGTTSSDHAYGIATDQVGNVFICGYTWGTLEEGQYQGQEDAFLAKYDTQGRRTWLRQIGTYLWDQANSIATDQLGNVFICGFTRGDLEEGQYQGWEDAFLAKYDTQGRRIWLRQIGTPSRDQANAIATDHLGNVFISGNTQGDLEEGQYQGVGDAFLAKYVDDLSNLMFHHLVQFVTPSE